MARRTHENTGRVLALAAAFFGGLAALGLASGVYERLGAELTAMLAIFAIAFALLTWHLDPGVRALARRLLAPRGTLAKHRGDRAATI